jgi:hypothetical protein
MIQPSCHQNYSLGDYMINDTTLMPRGQTNPSWSCRWHTKNYYSPSTATTLGQFGGCRVHSQTLAYYAHKPC